MLSDRLGLLPFRPHFRSKEIRKTKGVSNANAILYVFGLQSGRNQKGKSQALCDLAKQFKSDN